MRLSLKRTKQVLACAALLLMSSCKEALVHNLSEPDANRVVTVLAKEQLLAEKRAEGNNWSVVVDSDQFLRALEILEVSRVFAK